MIRHLANPPRASSGRTKHHLLSACMWPCRGGRPWAGLTETRSSASDLRPGPAIGRHTRAHLSHFPEGDFGWSHSAIKAASNVARNNPALVSLADTAQIADEKSRVPRSGRLHNELAGANAGGLFPLRLASYFERLLLLLMASYFVRLSPAERNS